LVVFSACGTGFGEVEAGEGVFGLRRALQEAGAASVLMSLWSVPDIETREFMKLFYHHWIDLGEDKPTALWNAQTDLRLVVEARYQRDLPYYWGAFVLVGR
jgi:CHAT domain-containing protein